MTRKRKDRKKRNRKKPNFLPLGKGYKIMVAAEMVSNECLDALAKVSVTSVDEFLKLVEKTMKNFRRLRIARVVSNHVPEYRRCSPNKAVNKPVTTGQLKALLQKLFLLLFPQELLGEENWKVVVFNFVKVFRDLRTRGDVASFPELFDGITLCKIKWLDGVPFRLKTVVLKNLLQYFVILFVNVLSAHFYITMNSFGRIVYYRKSLWKRVENKGFELLKAQRALKITDGVSTELPIHKLRFLPKTSGFRPIVTFKDRRVSHELNEIKAVLDLIVDENPALLGWGISNLRIFQMGYRKFVLGRKKKPNEPLFWSAVDLGNCFTNINHYFLEKILKKVLPENRSFVVVRATVMNSRLNFRCQRRAAGPSYTQAMQRIRCKDDESLTDNPVGLTFSGQEIFRRIRDFALRTIVMYNGVKYQAGCGIAQGNAISVKLCNLYLGTVERLIFPERPVQLFCRRYVDDYIMISTNQEQVKDVLQKLRNQGSRYGVHLNSQKIVSSFDNNSIPGLKRLRRNEKLAWCGFAFNTKTLSVTVDYHRYRKRCPVYNVPSVKRAEQFNFLCFATKRLLKSRYMSLRSCAQVFPSHRRLALRRNFCRFAFEFYFRYFAKQLMLKMKNCDVRCFFNQLIRWISNDFRNRSLPDVAASSVLDL